MRPLPCCDREFLPMICWFLFYIAGKQLMCKMHGENSLKLAWAGDTSLGSFDLRLSRLRRDSRGAQHDKSENISED